MKKRSIQELYSIYKKHPKLVKDTRLVSRGCFFIALKGENFDANNFADEALERGASYVLIDNPDRYQDERYLLVDNVLRALQELAAYHRSQLKIPVLGITGSNGKTTTKELIYVVLSQQFETYCTAGNYNNHIGVPLSILEIEDKHEIAVIEMGANHQGEIDFLCGISQPDFGIITNIGKAHLEGFGGIEGVKKGKSELYKYLKKRQGKAFINGDDSVLEELAEGLSLIKYGTQAEFYCHGILKQSHPNLEGTWSCQNQQGKIHSTLYGAYNFYNILAAVAVGNYFQVSATAIDRGISTYASDNNRSQLIPFREAMIYLDAYNANPSSMDAASLNFSKNKNPKKMVLLGDMFELGPEEEKEHELLIQKCLKLNLSKAIFIGTRFFQHHHKYENAHFFPSTTKAKEWLQKEDIAGFDILIKGSRGMALEQLLT